MPARSPGATRALAARDRSRRALEQRLERAGVPAATRDEALGALERVGLVDDARVARTRAAALAGRGYGDAAIRFDLEREGLPAEAVADAVAALESGAGAGPAAARAGRPQSADAPPPRGARLRRRRRSRISAGLQPTPDRRYDPATLHPTFCLHTRFFPKSSPL